MPPQNVPPNADDDITLETIVEVLSDGPDIRYPADVFPTSGRVLKHPETGDIYLGDGQQFHNVSSAVGLSTPSHTTDQVNNTHRVHGGGDESDIQNAIDKTSDSPPIERIDAEGQFDVSSPITISGFVWLDLRGAELVVQPGFSDSRGVLEDDGNDPDQIHITGGLIDGNKANVSNAVTGIDIITRVQPNGYVEDPCFLFNNVNVRNTTGGGIEADVRRAVWLNCTVYQSDGVGWKIRTSDQMFINCGAQRVGSIGWSIQRSFSHFYHCYAAQCSGRGVHINNGTGSTPSYTVWHGGYIENNDAPIRVDDGSDENRFEDVLIINNGQGSGTYHGIVIGGDYNRVKDCMFYDDKSPTQQDDPWKVESTGTENRFVENELDGKENQPGSPTDNGAATMVQQVPAGQIGKMRKDSKQSIGTAGSWIQVEWEINDVDNLGYVDTTNNEFSVARSGGYKIEAKVRHAGGGNAVSGDDVVLAIRVNDSPVSNLEYERPADFHSSPVISDSLELDAGDTVQIYIKNEDNTDDIASGSASQYFTLRS